MPNDLIKLVSHGPWAITNWLKQTAFCLIIWLAWWRVREKIQIADRGCLFLKKITGHRLERQTFHWPLSLTDRKWSSPSWLIIEGYSDRIVIWASLLQQDNNPTTGNLNYVDYMWIIINGHFCRGWLIFLLGQIKSDISTWKWQTLEAFLKLKYTRNLHFLPCRRILNNK